MKDIAIIIPIHELNEETEKLLINSIETVPTDLEIRISCKNGLSEPIKKIFKENKNVTIYEDTNTESKNDFCTLVNQAVGDTKWFSILELDDEYTSIWFNNFKKYLEYLPTVSIFMPLVDLIDYPTKKVIGIGNEAAWASSFSNEIGYIDGDCIESYFDFYLTGAIFNTEDWINVGGLKPSNKVTFWYEFMLRMAHNNKQIYVIPKVGYKHYFNRENSLMNILSNTIDENESTWWLELAKQEYVFKEDRNKTYTQK